MFLSPFLSYVVVVLRVSQGRRERLVVAGLEAREVVSGARAGARRGPEAHAPGDEVGPRGPRARPVARLDARRMFWSEVGGVLALGRDARRRGPSRLSLLLAMLRQRVPFNGPRKGRRPLDLVVARPLAVAEPLE